MVKEGGGIIGSAGLPGSSNTTFANITGHTTLQGKAGGHAIDAGNAVDLYIENYGTIAGGGGGGGSGGPAINASTQVQGGTGGYGAGYNSTLGYITEGSSDNQGNDAASNYGIHGGDGGLLGQLGIGAGGFDDAAQYNDGSETNPGTNYSQYANSGHGGIPGAAIINYDVSRITFINTGNVFGDSAYKFKA